MTPEEAHEWRKAQSECAALEWHWDGAYHFSWAGGEFRAVRADNGAVITHPDLLTFRNAVRLDYCNNPVPRET